jgi:hypothetical protein
MPRVSCPNVSFSLKAAAASVWIFYLLGIWFLLTRSKEPFCTNRSGFLRLYWLLKSGLSVGYSY